jgi:hypothetical protein
LQHRAGLAPNTAKGVVMVGASVTADAASEVPGLRRVVSDGTHPRRAVV